MFIWNPRASRSHHFKPALMSTSITNVSSSQALGIILIFLFKLKKISITFHVKGFVIGHWNADEPLTFLISFSKNLCNARDGKFFSSQALDINLIFPVQIEEYQHNIFMSEQLSLVIQKKKRTTNLFHLYLASSKTLQQRSFGMVGLCCVWIVCLFPRN